MRSAWAWTSTGRPTALAATEYLLLSKRTRQVFETDACTAWNPSNPLFGPHRERLLIARNTHHHSLRCGVVISSASLRISSARPRQCSGSLIKDDDIIWAGLKTRWPR